MKFPAYLQQLLKAGKSANGHGLSQLLRRDGPKADQLLSGLGDADVSVQTKRERLPAPHADECGEGSNII
jgi:hypothetical protein